MIGGAILVGKRLGLLCTATPPCCKNGTFFEEISPVRNRHSGGYGVGLRMNVGLPSVSVMKHRERQHPLSQRRAFAPVIAVCCAVLGAFVVGFSTHPAHALPSFARQTGQPCGTCHTDLPALTPFGRRFKLFGYTIGGGKFRTTPVPTSVRDKFDRAVAYGMTADLPFPALAHTKDEAVLAAYVDGIYEKAADAKAIEQLDGHPDKIWVPPISMMGIIGLTHTEAPLLPPTDPYQRNDNVVLTPVSFFWGGAITDNIGAFAQLTYNAPPPGGFPDPFGHSWTWDNTDIRYANTLKIGSMDVIFGITANNNPTVQDVWNTTPAWTFPYAVSNIAPTPATKTLIDGTFAAHVGSVGAYAFINDILYLEATAYRTLDFHTQNSLGVDPFSAPGLFDGVAPYWRIALEPHWGDHWLMVGAFGMLARVNPWIGPGNPVGTTATFPQTDNFADIGVDAQYQYEGRGYWLTLRGSLIREFQQLNASFANGLSANPTNDLNTLRLQASGAFGADNRVVFTGQYFNTWGTPDAILYAGLASGLSPDSSGWIAEIAYIPYGVSKAPGWPWANARIGLQYTWYDKFDGTSNGAHNNNTLFLYAWFAM